MSDNLLVNNNNLNDTFENIKELAISSRNKVYSAVNTEMLNLYWKSFFYTEFMNYEKILFNLSNLEDGVCQIYILSLVDYFRLIGMIKGEANEHKRHR